MKKAKKKGRAGVDYAATCKCGKVILKAAGFGNLKPCWSEGVRHYYDRKCRSEAR